MWDSGERGGTRFPETGTVLLGCKYYKSPGDSRIPPGRGGTCSLAPGGPAGHPGGGRYPGIPRDSYEFIGFLKISYVLVDLVLVRVPCVVPLVSGSF